MLIDRNTRGFCRNFYRINTQIDIWAISNCLLHNVSTLATDIISEFASNVHTEHMLFDIVLFLVRSLSSSALLFILFSLVFPSFLHTIYIPFRLFYFSSFHHHCRHRHRHRLRRCIHSLAIARDYTLSEIILTPFLMFLSFSLHLSHSINENYIGYRQKRRHTKWNSWVLST